jgi:hypothetical protein
MRYSKKLQMIGISVFLLFVIGCISDEANRYYLKEKLPPKNASDVEILREKPQQPYTVIADFQAKNGFWVSVTPQYMQKRAAEIGADAVIIVPTGGLYSWNETRAGGEAYSNSYTGLVGTAIKYK